MVFSSSLITRVYEETVGVVDDCTGVAVTFDVNEDTLDHVYSRRIIPIFADSIFEREKAVFGDDLPSIHDAYWKLWAMAAPAKAESVIVVWNRPISEIDRRYIARFRWKLVKTKDDLNYVTDSRDRLSLFEYALPKGFRDFAVVQHSVSQLISAFTIARRRNGVRFEHKHESRFKALKRLFPIAVEARLELRSFYTGFINDEAVSVSGHMISMLGLDAAGVHDPYGDGRSVLESFLQHIAGNFKLSAVPSSSRLLRQISMHLTEFASSQPQLLYHTVPEYMVAIATFIDDYGDTPGAVKASRFIHDIKHQPMKHKTIADYAVSLEKHKHLWEFIPDAVRLRLATLFPDSKIGDGVILGRRNRFLVAPPGSGKTTWAEDRDDVLDADSFLRFPRARWWDDAKLRSEVDAANKERLEAKLKLNEGLIIVYGATLGIAPDFVVVVPEDLHKARLNKRSQENSTQPDDRDWRWIKPLRSALSKAHSDVLFDSFEDVSSVLDATG